MVEKKSEAEYNSWKSEKRIKEQESKELNNQISGINAKITRLIKAKEKMERVKEDFMKYMPFSMWGFGISLGAGGQWKGTTKDKYNDNKNLLDTELRDYERDIDLAIDNMNSAITDYQNQILEKQGILGKLVARINTLVTKIENWST